MGQSQYRKNKKKCLELMKKESYKEALQILQTLESNNLKNKSEISEFISFQRGLCYMALKQNRDAIQQFEKCNSKQSKINIGLMKIKLNQLDEAKDYFQNLIRNSRYKNNPYVLQLYGYCILVGDKDYHYAAQIFEQSVSLENKLFSAYHNLSLCYLSLREVEKAKYFLEKSLSINPNFELSLELKKLIYLQFVQEQNFDEDNYFERGESIDPIIIDYGASIVNLNPLDLIYSKKQEIIAFQQIQFLTPSYKIPEDKVDSRSDIFNLGKIILEVYSNSGLILLQDFQIDTSRLKKDEISNQLLNYIQEEIRNKDIFERPSTELILYQFQKDYLFDLIHSCLIDQSLMDYQMFMASMYNHFEQFWIEFFLGQNDQQQIEQQTSTNFIIENKQLFSIFKLYKIIDNELLTEILFDNRLMYYFTHGVLNFLPIEKADLEDLVLNIQIKKKISQYENQKLKVQIELERNIFKDIISQINKKEQKGLESSFISQIQVEEQKEGSQTQGYQNINQYYTEAINQIKQQITDDYIQNQFLQNIRTVAQKFQQNEINFQSQDITQMYLQENTYDYFNK